VPHKSSHALRYSEESRRSLQRVDPSEYLRAREIIRGTGFQPVFLRGQHGLETRATQKFTGSQDDGVVRLWRIIAHGHVEPASALRQNHL
jgi:hypothetical protein